MRERRRGKQRYRGGREGGRMRGKKKRRDIGMHRHARCRIAEEGACMAGLISLLLTYSML